MKPLRAIQLTAGIFILLSVSFSFSQNKLSYWQPAWASVSVGITANTDYPTDTLTYRSLAKNNSAALFPDLTGFKKQKYFSFNGGGEFSMSAAMRLRNSSRSGFDSKKLLRLGVSYCSNSYFTARYNSTNAVRFDTLSSSSVNTLYLDSVFSRDYNFSYDMRQVGLDAALLFNTDTGKIIGLYGGFQLSQFFSTLNTVTVSYHNWSRVTQTNQSGEDSNFSDGESEFSSTEVEAKSSFSTRIGIPVGGTLRLAKTKKFWRGIQLFGEVRPSLEITAVPAYRTYVRPIASWQAGLRVLFYK